jgi:hypothetical protein
MAWNQSSVPHAAHACTGHVVAPPKRVDLNVLLWTSKSKYSLSAMIRCWSVALAANSVPPPVVLGFFEEANRT